jgi:hypothetical protein
VPELSQVWIRALIFVLAIGTYDAGLSMRDPWISYKMLDSFGPDMKMRFLKGYVNIDLYRNFHKIRINQTTGHSTDVIFTAF